MTLRQMTTVVFAFSMGIVTLSAQQKDGLTYKKDVDPIVQKKCLPCHLAESENPSGLALDSYATLMKGGEHGEVLVPEKPDESLLYQKLLDEPPFGKRMPRNRKSLTEADIRTIYTWIKQGAREE